MNERGQAQFGLLLVPAAMRVRLKKNFQGIHAMACSGGRRRGVTRKTEMRVYHVGCQFSGSRSEAGTSCLPPLLPLPIEHQSGATSASL